MSSRLRAVIIFAVYTFLVCTFTVLFFIFFTKAESVLPPDSFGYRLNKGFIFFFNLIPAVLMTAEIFGFSWFFGISSSGREKRFSTIMLGHFKSVLIICVSCVLICFVVKEALIPIVEEKISVYEIRQRNFVLYTELANENANEGSYDYARFYADEALKLYPDSAEAKELARHMEEEEIKARSKSGMTTPDTQDKGYYAYQQGDSLAYSSLQKAEKALADSDYINAHYYAELAKKTTGRDDQNKARAQEISSIALDKLSKNSDYLEIAEIALKTSNYIDAHYYAELAKKTNDEEIKARANEISSMAWDIISNNDDLLNKGTDELYKTKKEAYIALERGDVLKAYYTLLKLNDLYPSDPDVKNYFAATMEKLQKQYFFVDETTDMRDFEAANDVYFAWTKADGTIDIIFIGGISIVEDTGQFVQYFRNFSVTTVSPEGDTIQFFSVPYAKMTAQLVSSLRDSGLIDANWEIKTSNDQYVPFIFLEGVDREADNLRNGKINPSIAPKYKYPQEEDPLPFYLLDIPFGDLTLIRLACGGPENMPFISLLRFASKADQYGFSSEIYSCALAKRCCYPFIILVFMIFFAVVSFNYRLLSGHMFRFGWILLFPIMTAGIYFMMMLADYLESIVAISMYSLLGAATPIGMLGIVILLVLLTSFRFLSVHGE
ncbi:MAG: hypothetical protein J5747_05985 [Spirochaetaceae bacterium]|nr:hypothetical protein [Spirochaetaceae bacterium]